MVGIRETVEPTATPTQTVGQNQPVHITAKAEYAMRALLTLAAQPDDSPVTADRLAEAQSLPVKFLENILVDLRRSGLVRSQRGTEGGYWLARPAGEIRIADVIRAVEGPLASVRGEPPENVHYTGAAEPLGTLWVAVRANLRAVLEETTIADIANGSLPKVVETITSDPQAWEPH